MLATGRRSCMCSGKGRGQPPHPVMPIRMAPGWTSSCLGASRRCRQGHKVDELDPTGGMSASTRGGRVTLGSVVEAP